MRLVNGANGTAANATYPALAWPQTANVWTAQRMHYIFTSGTYGGASVQIQISPDGLNPADGGDDTNAPLAAASRWYNLADAIGLTTTPLYGVTQAQWRKARAVVTGATNTTANLIVEVLG